MSRCLVQIIHFFTSRSVKKINKTLFIMMLRFIFHNEDAFQMIRNLVLQTMEENVHECLSLLL